VVLILCVTPVVVVWRKVIIINVSIILYAVFVLV